MGGWFEVSLPGYVYDLLGLAAGFTLAGLTLLAVNSGIRATLSPALRRFLLLGLLGAFLVLVGTVQYNTTLPQPHGRYFLVLAPFVGPALALGFTSLFTMQARRGSAVSMFWPAALLIVNMYALLRVVPAYYGDI